MEKSLKILETKARKEINDQALEEAGFALWQTIINVPPKPPIDTSNLRDSGFVFVGSKQTFADTFGATSHNGKPNVATVGLNTPYTAYQHNLYPAGSSYESHKRPSNNTDSGAGFISRKLGPFKKEFIDIIEDTADRLLK